MGLDRLGSSAIADDAVAAADIADGSISTAKLANDAITTAKVADTVNLGRRNLVINGAMNVAQRGTSVTGVTGTGYYTVDRFSTDLTTLATWSISQSTDAPEGFAYSLLHDCTTADASPAAGDTFRLSYRFEGQDLQHLQKGTSSAKSCILSFWIKSNKTGTGQFNIRDIDNNRGINKTYTIDAADTWEKKTILIEGDTTGTISNDNGSSFWLLWVFNSGTDNTSGTFNDAWHAFDWTDVNAAGTLDIGASTSDYVKITGVQLEVGDTATPFEHRTYGEELALCQRYYQTYLSGETNASFCVLQVWSANNSYGGITFPTMRTIPTHVFSGEYALLSGGSVATYTGGSEFYSNKSTNNTVELRADKSGGHSFTVGGAAWVRANNTSTYWTLDAEL